MKKIITILFIALASTSKVWAQSELRISLSQARELGLQNRFDVKAELINIEIAKKK